ncbi:MAG: hypothetical protein HOP07_10175 [Bacteriovoracaceae bacterium]|nr:hypothetical protein [Bacteriovoracaceae bacterium]
MRRTKKVFLTLFIFLLSLTIFFFIRTPRKRLTAEIKHTLDVNRKEYSRKNLINKSEVINKPSELSEKSEASESNPFNVKIMQNQSLEICNDIPAEFINDVKCSDIERLNLEETDKFLRENQKHLSTIKEYIVNNSYDTVSRMVRFINPNASEEEAFSKFVNNFGPVFNMMVISHIISSRKHNIPLEDIDLYAIADEFDEFSSKLEKKMPFLTR